MRYRLGIDLGTTYTGAAVVVEGRVEPVNLGTRAAVLPTVVYVREDGDVLVGEAAETRGVMDPSRVAREFKRRLGDTTPLVLGGTPYSAEVLMGFVLRHVYDVVTERRGAAPEAVVVTHPASYTQYRLDLLRDAASRAGIGSCTFLPEPVAAALHYASLDRVADGSTIAVYDLGGGTFDAAILRRVGEGFELIGEPKGLERLGGVDVDAAVIDHVAGRLGDRFERLADDPAARPGLARVRSDSRHAKEVLSSDSETAVPVIVPGITDSVAITRGELERVIRPRIRESVVALRAAIASAGLEPKDLGRVLLVGGSSRMPIVRRLLEDDLGITVTADVDPEMAVVLGAAQHAATIASAPTAADAGDVTITAPPPPATRSPPAPLAAPPPPVAPKAPAAAPTTPGGEPSLVPAAAPRRTSRAKWLVAGGGAVAIIAALVVVLLVRGGSDDGGSDDSGGRDGFVAVASGCASAAMAGGAIEDESTPPPELDGRCNLSSLDLTDADLSGLDLSNALLSDATLVGTNFDGTVLEGAELERATAAGARFEGANLIRANLADIGCDGCDFLGADLTGANLSGASLLGATLQFADTESTDLSGVAIDDLTLLGPAQGPVFISNGSGAAGLAAFAVDRAQRTGYNDAQETHDFDRDVSAVACSGEHALSDQRKLVLLLEAVGGVVADEVDFDELVDVLGGPAASVGSDACVVVLGVDLANSAG